MLFRSKPQFFARLCSIYCLISRNQVLSPVASNTSESIHIYLYISMFTRTIIRNGVSPYLLFMKQNYKKFPITAFSAPTRQAAIAKIGRAMGKAYRNLSAAEFKVLKQKAMKMKASKHKKKFKDMTPAERRKKYGGQKKVYAFAKFVKANYKKVRHDAPAKRLKALAQLYKKSKQSNKSK